MSQTPEATLEWLAPGKSKTRHQYRIWPSIGLADPRHGAAAVCGRYTTIRKLWDARSDAAGGKNSEMPHCASCKKIADKSI